MKVGCLGLQLYGVSSCEADGTHHLSEFGLVEFQGEGCLLRWIHYICPPE